MQVQILWGVLGFGLEALLAMRCLGKAETEGSIPSMTSYGDVIYGLGCNAFNIVNRVQVPASLLCGCELGRPSRVAP